MSKVFIIPDLHLKPEMFEKASKKIAKGDFDYIVFLGDLVDDWGQQTNIKLYIETFDAAIEFVNEHPNTLWCYGNHEMSYIWKANESGYSYYAEAMVVKKFNELKKTLPPGNSAFLHNIDNVLFSHAGLMKSFYLEHFGKKEIPTIKEIVRAINSMGKNELWKDNSPIWARPLYGGLPCSLDVLQIVGHTPVKSITYYGKQMVIVDTFSTYPDGRPIGDEKFTWVNTETKTINVLQ